MQDVVTPVSLAEAFRLGGWFFWSPTCTRWSPTRAPSATGFLAGVNDRPFAPMDLEILWKEGSQVLENDRGLASWTLL